MKRYLLTTLSLSLMAAFAIAAEPAAPISGIDKQYFDTSVRPFINGGRVVFAGNGSVRKGIFEWTIGGITTIVDMPLNSLPPTTTGR